MLPEGVSIISPSQRDWDDSYVIESGRTFCFEFEIQPTEVIDFQIIHTRVQSQDLSLRCWFSEKPFGSQKFTFEDDMDSFTVPRMLRTIRIGGELTGQQFQMESGQKNYIMVQNLQNAINFFKLIIEPKLDILVDSANNG